MNSSPLVGVSHGLFPHPVVTVHTVGEVVAICAFKGGVGKTTVTANLAAAWSRHGQGAIIDMDPQGNLSRAFGIHTKEHGKRTVAELLTTASRNANTRIQPDDWSVAYTHTTQPLLVLEAGNPQDLTSAQDLLVAAPGGETALQRLLTDARNEVDWILIDTPPAAGRLTMNAVLASNSVFAVVNPAYWSADGASRVSAYVSELGEFIPTTAHFRGAILNRVPGGKRAVVKANLEALEQAGVPLLHTIVPERIAIQEGETISEPIVSADPTSNTAKTFITLSEEVRALVNNTPFEQGTVVSGKKSKKKGKK